MRSFIVFRGVTRFTVFAAFLLFSLFAQASSPSPVDYWHTSVFGFDSGIQPTPEAACQNAFSQYDAYAATQNVDAKGHVNGNSIYPATAGQPVSQISNIDYHPTLALPSLVTNPGKLTTLVYNGQPDPFNSGATANCAPAGATLPDSSPIAVRQRLTSTTVGGQTTGYSYDPTGQLTRVTAPDGTYVGFEYDAAHRNTAVDDNQGNRIEYTLDNAGNQIGQNVKDPGGNLARASIDALGRVQQVAGTQYTSL